MSEKTLRVTVLMFIALRQHLHIDWSGKPNALALFQVVHWDNIESIHFCALWCTVAQLCFFLQFSYTGMQFRVKDNGMIGRCHFGNYYHWKDKRLPWFLIQLQQTISFPDGCLLLCSWCQYTSMWYSRKKMVRVLQIDSHFIFAFQNDERNC